MSTDKKMDSCGMCIQENSIIQHENDLQRHVGEQQQNAADS